MTRYAVRCAECFHPLLVPFGIFAAELEIAMRDTERYPGLTEQVKHHYRINATAYRKEDFIRSFAKVVELNMV